MTKKKGMFNKLIHLAFIYCFWKTKIGSLKNSIAS